VEFADSPDHEAQRTFPLSRDMPVVIDPPLASASATVRGVRVLAERLLAQETIDDVADEFGLELDDVTAAMAYQFECAA
jgi:uncharacterized protein (DUF433 family)